MQYRKPGTATTFPAPFAGNMVTVPGFAYGKRSVVVAFGPRRAHPNHRTCAFLVRRPGRTPSPQDLQLETPPQYTLAGNPVVAPHLPLRASLFAAGCFGCPLPVCLLSPLRNSQGPHIG